jgi:hypothetical protein
MWTFGFWYVLFDGWLFICLKRIDCVFLLVLCVNYLFVKYTEVVIGHFGFTKTLDVLHEHFYWPKM